MSRDNELRQLVIDELEWEPQLNPAHIGIARRDGVITLSGHVASYAAKKHAERAARRVRGVKAIAVELGVRLPSDEKTEDDEIAARAVRILEWDIAVPPEQIQVKVERGVVRVSGTVDWRFQKDDAEHNVRKLGGVIGVINEIMVQPNVQAADVRANIVRALERNAALDASRVTVAIEGGKASAWLERDIVEQAAWSAPAVIAVEDRITIG